MKILMYVRHGFGFFVLVLGFLGMTLFGLLCIFGAWLADKDELASSAWGILRGRKVHEEK